MKVTVTLFSISQEVTPYHQNRPKYRPVCLIVPFRAQSPKRGELKVYLIVSAHNTYANLGGSLVVRRCIDKPKWGNYPINLRF